MKRNSKEPGQLEDWTPCSPGTLTSIARGLRSRRRHRVIRQVAATAAMLILAVGVGAWALKLNQPATEHHFGGVWCHEVRANLPAYSMGEVDEELADKMRIHLAECPSCQKLMRQMRGEQAEQTEASTAATNGATEQQVVSMYVAARE